MRIRIVAGRSCASDEARGTVIVSKEFAGARRLLPTLAAIRVDPAVA